MVTNYIEKDDENFIFIQRPEGKILAESNDLEKFIYKILDLGNLRGGIHIGTIPGTHSLYLNPKESKLLWKIYFK